ncbi:hypothetical protein [Alicyclobacillus ferrooxydans]|uniref:Uncharacterized protein n=1 Tax=Alicyclobacillus ferrooxydans TaxID=471514 RepID=A0A0P9GWF2_9BACL|nr:hypothetical protein [Alicyclobacillus ferrooxydans]KPV45626.1 hypothetical protein AN477_01545 [Alicyclobacillus ferrooxydans]
MNWFDNLIANLINALANGIQMLLDHTIVSGGNVTGNVMGNVILTGFFPSAHVPAWGTGSFADVMDAKATTSLQPFAVAFWAFGWTFLLVALYLLVIQVSGAANSAIQRERLKNGCVGLVIAAVMMWVGPHFAVLITQLFYYPSDYFLTLNPLMKWTSLNTSGGQGLLNSVVNFLQAILSLVVWLVYEFRKVFLYVWMLFFPLAMAFHANDRTRPIAKMWWTEWIYQMAIPLGQAIVFGIASAVASPMNSTSLTIEDIFVALAGTIGLLASAVYVRKLIEVVANTFGASMVGFNGGARLGQMAALGLSAYAADVGGKMAVKGAAKAIGTPAKSIFKAMDNMPAVRSKAEQAVKERPEMFAQAIQAGAGVDDMMLHHQLGAFGDAIQADGFGLESGGTKTRYASSMPINKGNSRQTGGLYGGPLKHSVRSGTLDAIRGTVSTVKGTVTNSNLGLIGKSLAKDYADSGGMAGAIASRTIPAIGTVANAVNGRFTGFVSQPVARASAKYAANQHLKQERLQTMRNHMRGVMETNSLAARLPNINHLYDPKENAFTRLSTAEESYRTAHMNLASALQSSTSMSSKQAGMTIMKMENQWNSGLHVSNLTSYSPSVQAAYKQAYSSYRPAILDRQAKDAVVAGRLHVTPPVDLHKNNRSGTQALMQDARNAVMYGR